jgi:hypothetical protein
MNRRQFVKRACGLAIALVLPDIAIKGKPYFTIKEWGWGGEWKAGETIHINPDFHMTDFGIEVKIPFLSATEDTHIIFTDLEET